MDQPGVAEQDAEGRAGEADRRLPSLHSGVNHGVQIDRNYGNVTNNVNIHSSSESNANIPPQSIFSVPYPRDKKFIPRQPIFDQIDSCIDDCQPVVLCGLGGTGKSQIAIEYAYRFRELHPQSFVFWVYAGNTAGILQSYRDIARKLRLPGYNNPEADVCQLVADWFEKDEAEDQLAPCKWLLVIDNLDSVRVLDERIEESRACSVNEGRSLHEYLPSRLNQHRVLLMSSRSQDVASAVSDIKHITVGPFTPSESLKLLLNKLGTVKYEKDKEQILSELVKRLGHLPLAITQAGAFIRRSRILPSEYLSRLDEDERQQAEYLSNELQDSRRPAGWPNSVFQTWQISFDDVCAIDQVAAEILSISAFLNGQQIPRSLFLQDQIGKSEVDHSLGTLFGYDLVSAEEAVERFSIHQLVQASLRFWLRQQGTSKSYATAAMIMVTDALSKIYKAPTQDYALLMLHAERLLEYDETRGASTEDSDTDCHKAHLLSLMLEIETDLGSRSKAWMYLKAGSELVTRLETPEVRTESEFLQSRATVVCSMEAISRASGIPSEVLSMYSKIFGEDTDNILDSTKAVTTMLRVRGKMDEARSLLQEVAHVLEACEGMEHIVTIQAKFELAKILKMVGNLTEANHLCEEMLTTKIIALDSTLKLEILALQFEIFKKDGKLEDAMDTISQAMKIFKDSGFIKDSFTLHFWYKGYASILEQLGMYQEALDLRQKCLLLSKERYGALGVYVTTDMASLARVLECLKRYHDARVMYLDAEAGYEKILGPEADLTKSFRVAIQRVEAMIAGTDQGGIDAEGGRREDVAGSL